VPESRGAPAHRVIDLVQQLEPGGKQGVAPLKRSRRWFFGMITPCAHRRQNNPRWLRSSCKPSRRLDDRLNIPCKSIAPSWRPPCLRGRRWGHRCLAEVLWRRRWCHLTKARCPRNSCRAPRGWYRTPLPSRLTGAVPYRDPGYRQPSKSRGQARRRVGGTARGKGRAIFSSFFSWRAPFDCLQTTTDLPPRFRLTRLSERRRQC